MKPIEKPMLFSAAMVLAILAGNKTQTRRIIKPQPAQREGGISFCHHGDAMWSAIGLEGDRESYKCPHPVGSLIWAKETFLYRAQKTAVLFRAECDQESAAGLGGMYGGWKPSIFMPRWASRITLEVTGVRVERLQDISEADAKAEGAMFWWNSLSRREQEETYSGVGHGPRGCFHDLVESVHGAGYWKRNPFVWAYAFRRVKL